MMTSWFQHFSLHDAAIGCADRRSAIPAVLLIAAAFLCGAPAIAAPASWYWWYSKLNGKPVCAQTSPGDGWEQGGSAYRDASCRQRLNVFFRGARQPAQRSGTAGQTSVPLPETTKPSSSDSNH